MTDHELEMLADERLDEQEYNSNYESFDTSWDLPEGE